MRSVDDLALSVKSFGFASSPKGRAFREKRKLTVPQKPLTSGEVALRSNDGEGKLAKGTQCVRLTTSPSQSNPYGFASSPKGRAFGEMGRASALVEEVTSVKATTVVKNNKMLEVARKLRREMTPQEKKLWYQFLRTYPIKIYKQRIIESFIVDFYCAEARLVIELDGSQHYTEQGQAYDAERSQILREYGLKTLRFSNGDVEQRFEEVCDKIHKEIEARK